jgi:hypothetical protein
MKNIILMILFIANVTPMMAEDLNVAYQELDSTFFEKPDPDAKEWSSIPSRAVDLFPQNITAPSLAEGSVAQIQVKGVINKTYIAFWLSWSDASASVAVSSDQFSDACAIQFPLAKGDETSPFMGNTGAPVAIMHWKAIWQNDIDSHYQVMKDLYPNSWTDTTRFGREIAIEVKNPVAQPSRTSPVEELVAAGFGTLTTQMLQESYGRGIWKDGKWKVVIARKLSTSDAQDPQFQVGKQSLIAFAVWEGSKQNIGGRKNYAPWTPIKLLEGTK